LYQCGLALHRDHPLGVIVEAIQQIGSRFAQDGVYDRGIYITDGLEDKGPFMHPWMGDLQPGQTNDLIVE
jgi:hypothetical protein